MRLREFYRYKIKYPYQRATRGYDDLALWNMNTWFFGTGLKILNQWLKDGVTGHPPDMYYGEYISILTQIRDGFQAYMDSENMVNFEKYSHKKYIELDNKRTEDAQNAANLFAELVMTLWD